MSDLLLSASFENSLIHAYENIGLIFPEYQTEEHKAAGLVIM